MAGQGLAFGADSPGENRRLMIGLVAGGAPHARCCERWESLRRCCPFGIPWRRTHPGRGALWRKQVQHSATSWRHLVACWSTAWRNALGWVIGLVLLALATTSAAKSTDAPLATGAEQTIEAFVREGCSHCADAKAFLARLQQEQPGLAVVVRDVIREPAAMVRLQQLTQAHGAGLPRVPTLWVGGQLIVGFSPAAHTDRLIRLALAGQQAPRQASPDASAPAGSCETDDSLLCKAGPDAAVDPTLDPQLLGVRLSLDTLGLPLFALTMGLLGGFSPCAMWVLLLMMSVLAPLKNRWRMLVIAGTFVLVEGLTYGLFMMAWLNLFLLVGLSRASQLAVAAFALAGGMINVKDFFAFGHGPSLSIPERTKPGIYERLRGVLHAPTLGAAVAGAGLLAVLVQGVDLLCTTGFLALFTRVLTLQNLDSMAYAGHLALYLGAYLLNHIVVLGAGVALLSRQRLQEAQGRWLKLLSGIVMIGLGLYLLWL